MSKSCLRKVNFVFAIELFVTGEWDFSLKRQKQMHGYFAGRSQRRQCGAIFAGHKGHRKVSCLEGCLGGASWPLCLGLVRFMSWMGLRALCVLDGASCPLCLGWGFVPSCLGWGLGASFWASAALVSWMGLRAFYEAFAAVVSWMGLDFLFLAAVPLCLVSKLTFSWKLPSVPRDYSWHDSRLDGECGWQVYGQGVFDLAECSEKNPRGAEAWTEFWHEWEEAKRRRWGCKWIGAEGFNQYRRYCSYQFRQE